jgi:hypothetical protein
MGSEIGARAGDGRQDSGFAIQDSGKEPPSGDLSLPNDSEARHRPEVRSGRRSIKKLPERSWNVFENKGCQHLECGTEDKN